MSDLNSGPGKTNKSGQADAFITSRATFWMGFASVLILLIVLVGEAIFRYYLNVINGDLGYGLLVLMNSLLFFLLPFVIAIVVYLQVKRYLSRLTDDPEVLRTVTNYGLTVLFIAYMSIFTIYSFSR
jgi:membrane protein implicated in regulation of membrane protease activity